MPIDQFQSNPDSESYAQREAVIKHSGELLAAHLLSSEDPQLLLDMDGVVFQADSLHTPRLTTLDIVPTLQSIEDQGVAIGPATGRGMHVVDFLRGQGLQLSGPAILEEGQTIVQNGVVEHLGHPNHRAFMDTMREAMEDHPEFVPSWDQARVGASEGRFSFSPGNIQWQGACRSSFWFPYDGDPSRDAEIVSTRIEPVLQALAPQHGLDYDRDVAVSVYRMQPSVANGNLAIVGIKGTAAERLQGTWGFAADGFGDTPLAKVTKARSGMVIGIEGNLDMTNDAPEFLRTADTVLRNPREFVGALRHTANMLRAGKSR